MTRRSKMDMGYMKNDVRYYLLQCNNEPHKAHEMMIKECLESAKMIPYYIKGVKDFISESQKLAVEWNRKDQMKKTDRDRRERQDNDTSRIVNMGVDEIKGIYKEYKDKVNNDDKLILVDTYTMIYNNELTDKHVNASTIRLFNKIWNEMNEAV